MKILHYPADEKGVCYGIAMRAEIARKLVAYDFFAQRIQYLNSLPPNKIIGLLRQAKKHNKALKKGKSNIPLSRDEEILLTVESFFSEVSELQLPQQFKKFLGAKGPYHFMHTYKREEKNEEKHEEKKEENSPVNYVLTDMGETGFQFLKNFLISAADSQIGFGMVISNMTHAVHVHLDQGVWYLTNHSSLETYPSVDKLVESLSGIYAKNQIVNLNFKIFVDEAPNRQLLLDQFQQLSNEALETVRRINSVNCEDKDWATPLGIAAMYGNLSHLKKILNYPEILINQANKWGETPLCLAAGYGHEDIVEELLKQRNISVNKPNEQGLDPLTVAAQNGHLHIVNRLLRVPNIEVNGADVPSSFYEVSPLYCAAKEGHFDVVKALLQHSNINVAKQNNGVTALSIAESRGHKDVVMLLKLHLYINKIETRINKQGSNHYAAPFFKKSRFTDSQKLNAAKALENVIYNGADINTLKEHEAVLKNGNLKKIYNLFLTNVYDIALISSSKKPPPQIIELTTEGRKNGYAYRVIGQDGKIKTGVIPWSELPSDSPKDLKEEDILSKKDILLPAILNFIAKTGQIQVHYQPLETPLRMHLSSAL